jgi:hypothetical protein
VTALDRPPATAVSAEVRVPPPLGAVLVVHHRGDYRLQCEHVREQQAVATAGFSVRYEDAWPAVHGAAPGHTFTSRNALVRAGEMPLERGRRIDYVMVRSSAHGPPLDVADCRLVLDGRRTACGPATTSGSWPTSGLRLILRGSGRAEGDQGVDHQVPGVGRRKLLPDPFQLDQARAGDGLRQRPAVRGREQRVRRAVEHERGEAAERAQPRVRGRVVGEQRCG